MLDYETGSAPSARLWSQSAVHPKKRQHRALHCISSCTCCPQEQLIYHLCASRALHFGGPAGQLRCAMSASVYNALVSSLADSMFHPVRFDFLQLEDSHGSRSFGVANPALHLVVPVEIAVLPPFDRVDAGLAHGSDARVPAVYPAVAGVAAVRTPPLAVVPSVRISVSSAATTFGRHTRSHSTARAQSDWDFTVKIPRTFWPASGPQLLTAFHHGLPREMHCPRRIVSVRDLIMSVQTRLVCRLAGVTF